MSDTFITNPGEFVGSAIGNPSLGTTTSTPPDSTKAKAGAGVQASISGPPVGPTSLGQKFAAGSGYWVAIGVIGSMLIAGTRVAPLVLGILSVALIYQTGLMIQGK